MQITVCVFRLVNVVRAVYEIRKVGVICYSRGSFGSSCS